MKKRSRWEGTIMGSNDEMTRKDFLTLTFTLIGSTVVGGACSSDDNNADGGFGGTFGNNGGTFGSGGRGGTTGTGGRGGTTGTAGTTGTGGAGGNGAAACADPLPEMQSPSDHTHTVTIPASMLNSTMSQTFNTSVELAHMHMVTLNPAQMTTLKGGGSVTVTSSVASAHTHDYTISCH
jgi:hypothetical protein